MVEEAEMVAYCTDNSVREWLCWHQMAAMGVVVVVVGRGGTRSNGFHFWKVKEKVIIGIWICYVL